MSELADLRKKANYFMAFLAGDFITGAGYGIQLALYSSCALHLFRHRHRRKNSLYILAYITLIMVIGTVFSLVQLKILQAMYINDSRWVLLLTPYWRALMGTFCSCFFVVTILSDVLLLWRCWVIWEVSGKLQAYFATFIPTLMLFASCTFGVLWSVTLNQPTFAIFDKLAMTYGIAFYALSLSTNVLLTLLIVLRLWLYRRQILLFPAGGSGGRAPAGFANQYISIAMILIESAALFSLFAIVFLLCYAVQNPPNQVFLGFASMTQQITSYMIIHRVAHGKAFNSASFSLSTSMEITSVRVAIAAGSSVQNQNEMSQYQARAESVLQTETQPHTRSEDQISLVA